MASHVSHREDLFPAGTSVSVYTDRGPITNVGTGAPSGTAITGSPFTVAGDGSLTVTGLTQGSKYVAYASSPDRYLRFSVPGPPTYRDLDLATIADGDVVSYDEATNTLVPLPVDDASGVAGLDANRKLNPVSAPLPTSDRIRQMGRNAIPLTIAGGITITNTDATVTCASTAGLAAGMEILAANVPTGTTIASITNSTTFEMSANATATGSGVSARAFTIKLTDVPTITSNASSQIASSAIQNTVASLSSVYRTSAKYLTGQSSSSKYFQGATWVASCTLNGTTTVTVNSTSGLVAGVPITGTGIPDGTTVSSVTNATTFVLSAAATISGTSTLTARSVNQQAVRIEVDFPGDKIEFRIANCYYRFWVDEELVRAVPTNFTPGAFSYVKLAFGNAKRRRIVLEMEYNGSYPQFYGVYCHPKYQVLPPSIQSACLIGVTDSYGQGIGATYAMDSYFVGMARLMGFAHVVLGQCVHGGTGFLTDNTDSNFARYISRIDDTKEMVQLAYDLGQQPALIVQGTINDVPHVGADTIPAAVVAYFASMREDFPDLPMFLTGLPYPATPTSDMLTLNDEYEEGATTAGVPFIDLLGAQTNPTRYFFNGTGTFAVPTGDGNADIYCAADEDHPSPDGHREGLPLTYAPVVAAGLGVDY